MDIKKTSEANLEKERFTFFLLGFAVALSCFFVLLEWQTPNTNNSDFSPLSLVFIENEFQSGIRNEEIAPVSIQKTPEQEIVYEDYIITDDITLIEKSNESFSGSATLNFDTDVLPHTKNEIETSSQEVANKEETATSAEAMPQFPGGQIALIRFLNNNTQYPSTALKQRIEGRVWCSFIVEDDGSISNINLEKSLYIFLDDEAIRVLNIMPNWIPGRTNGENVRVKVYIPIVFKR